MTEETPEIERRKLNIVEACILAAILGMATMLFSLRDSMIQVQEQLKAQNAMFTGMQSQLADVPSLNQRVSRVEVRQESIVENVKELRSMKGIK